jgi:peptide/nickel transport system permease protein
MTKWITNLLRKVLLLAVLAVVGALLCATMVRFAPGYGLDERGLDPRLSQASREAIRTEHQLPQGLPSYYAAYLIELAHGHFGSSTYLQRPVGEMLKERAPVTAKTVSIGLLIAWIAATTLSLLTTRFRTWVLDFPAIALTGFLVALPSAVVALMIVFFHAPVFLGIAVAIFPKLFRHQRNLLAHAHAQPFILAARARGVGSSRILFGHVIPLARPALVALVGMSSSMALGASIPLEALSDSPGVGQLAWLAALNRDLPLLTSITLLLTLVTVGVNFLGEAVQEKKVA